MRTAYGQAMVTCCVAVAFFGFFGLFAALVFSPQMGLLVVIGGGGFFLGLVCILWGLYRREEKRWSK